MVTDSCKLATYSTSCAVKLGGEGLLYAVLTVGLQQCNLVWAVTEEGAVLLISVLQCGPCCLYRSFCFARRPLGSPLAAHSTLAHWRQRIERGNCTFHAKLSLDAARWTKHCVLDCNA